MASPVVTISILERRTASRIFAEMLLAVSWGKLNSVITYLPRNAPPWSFPGALSTLSALRVSSRRRVLMHYRRETGQPGHSDPARTSGKVNCVSLCCLPRVGTHDEVSTTFSGLIMRVATLQLLHESPPKAKTLRFGIDNLSLLYVRSLLWCDHSEQSRRATTAQFQNP